MMDPYKVILRPVNTEKGHIAAEEDNVYVFEVADDATKQDIRSAVETIWDVKVEHVRTMNVAGKPKRFRYAWGHTKAWKKAMVRLAEDQAIDALR